MRINMTQFFGIAPKFDPEQLVEGYSTTSENTRSGRLMVEPWQAPSDLTGGTMPNASVRSLLLYQHDGDADVWFTWPDERYALRPPLINDVVGLAVIASASHDPAVTTSLVHGRNAVNGTPTDFKLGIPRPSAPVVTPEKHNDINPEWPVPNPEPEVDEYDDTYVSYSVCFVDAWGRVGPLSEPSLSYEHREYKFDSVYLPEIKIIGERPPIGVGPNMEKSYIRIFRSNYSAGSTGGYQYLDQIEATGADFLYYDKTFSGDLLDAPINEDWVGPPDTNVGLYPNGSMSKVVNVSGEFMCGHNRRIVCFSEPDAPHAWPVEYYQVFKESIVTVEAAGANVVILTDGFPYVLTGVHPANMSPTRLADPIPCVSAKGVVELNDSVFYVGINGLFRIEGFKITNVLQDYITDEEWQQLDPRNMSLASYYNRIFISCPTPGITYVYDPAFHEDALRTVQFNAQALHQLPETNDMAYIESGTSKIVVFDSHVNEFMALRWMSRIYQFNDPVAFSCARVRSKSYPVTVSFTVEHADGNHTFTKEVPDRNWFWIDMGNRGQRFWAEVTSVAGTIRPEIHDIQLASDPSELE